MFDRFTDGARKSMGLAWKAAQRFRHDYIGSEHMLLGLLEANAGLTASVLERLGVDRKELRRETERRVSPGPKPATSGQLPFTPRAKKALELALEEAGSLDQTYIGPEHLLLGLIGEKEGIAAQVFAARKVGIDAARGALSDLLGRTAAPPRRPVDPGPSIPLESVSQWLFSDPVQIALARGGEHAHERGSGMTPDDLWVGLLMAGIQRGPEADLGLPRGDLEILLAHAIHAATRRLTSHWPSEDAEDAERLDPDLTEVLKRAIAFARDRGASVAAPGDVLAALVADDGSGACATLREMGIDPATFCAPPPREGRRRSAARPKRVKTAWFRTDSHEFSIRRHCAFHAGLLECRARTVVSPGRVPVKQKSLVVVLVLLAAAAVFVFFVPIDVGGKKGPAKPGSPEFAEALNSKALPPVPPKFGGEIKEIYSDSKPWWPPTIVPPKGAPNVLLIMLDDAGFGSASTFGGTIPTPALDRVAKAGLRYTMFHSCALCSPTRAALITGRNHHSVHFGVVTEATTGYPGYDAIVTKDTASVGEILRGNGYATSWFGKDHNVPGWVGTQAGPFDQWPTGMGFEYFYGFIGGDTSQWQPNLFRNTTPIAPYEGNPSWNLVTAMADDAIGHMKMLNETTPEKPFFVYYVPGATHAPHHPTKEWIDKFKGKFDHGYNAERDRIFENQKRLGVIPANAKLTPWPDSVPKWDTLDADAKRMLARQAEVYAAYLAYADYEVGRVIQAVDDMGKLDDTLIVYIGGDNGASPEGTTVGTPNEFATFNSVVVPIKDQLKDYDDWGSDKTFPHYAVGWAWAFDTPFRWTKQVASYFGGTRQGMAMSWPARIKDAGGLRHQFHHVIDVVPTILEAAGITAPTRVDGITQRPIEGVSMAYSWDKAHADAPSARKTQYFEMLGLRGIYHEGWMASTVPPVLPWAAFEGLPQKQPKDILNGYTWELFDLAADPTQSEDLAAKNPKKLADMQRIFMEEARKYNVLPLDNRSLARFLQPRPSATGGRTKFVYTGELSNTPKGGAPSVLDRSFKITAQVEVPAAGAEGMLVTDGGRFGGYGLYLLKSKPTFVYNFVNVERFRWDATDALAPGKHTLVFEFKYDGIGFGHGGEGTLTVDGKEAAKRKIARTMPFTFPEDETFDVGVDTRTPIDDGDYQTPFRFTGKLEKLTFELEPIHATLAEILEFKWHADK